MIAEGQLSTVWKAHCRRTTQPEYAVKIFSGQQQKNSWLNEKEIYATLALSHNDHILKFIGVDSIMENDTWSYWLITEYHELGSLYDYLRMNRVSWPQMVQMAYSILDGLSFLHSSNSSGGGGGKTFSIAHRDLKSKNILVIKRKAATSQQQSVAQLSCCIGDFGLALGLDNPSKLQNAEIRNKVGTKRYMSPELLEGAISFTKETFLRIDVYACALVLWELISRGDFYSHSVKNDNDDDVIGDDGYKMPFELEVGLNPTLETMKHVVVENNQRPKIRAEWLKHYVISSVPIFVFFYSNLVY
jgi:serine/threonine protein kinase